MGPLLQNSLLFQAICLGCLWVRDKMWLLSRVQRLAGPAGGRGLLSRLETPTGIKGPPFVLVGVSNRDKRLLSRLEPPTGIKCPPFCPGWCLQPGQNSLAPLSRSLSPRLSHSAHLFLLFLAREGGVLAHFFTIFVKIFDSPVHPSALKIWGLFFSSSLACIAHFIL